MKNDELMHYGVLGMKWGVRRYQNKDGTLNAKGRKKYYDKNGRLNEEGKKLRFDARGLRTDGKRTRGNVVGSMALTGFITHSMYKVGRNFVHTMGNRTITNQALQGASFAKRRATAGAFIAGIGAITMAEIYPYAKLAARNTMYKKDADYKKRVDAMADMRDRLK